MILHEICISVLFLCCNVCIFLMTASNVDAEERHTWTTRCDTTGDINGVLHKGQENGEMARMPLMIIINDNCR